jgi:ribosome-associated protein
MTNTLLRHCEARGARRSNPGQMAAESALASAANRSSCGYNASMIRVTDHIAIDEAELTEDFVRSSGPGGQNVNKLSTAVQLRFDVRRSPSLPDEVRARLERLAGKRLTRDGVLVITAQRHRTQERNRADALERLVALVRQAAVRPVPRRPTKPTLASRKRRLDAKKRRSGIKAMRGRRALSD